MNKVRKNCESVSENFMEWVSVVALTQGTVTKRTFQGKSEVCFTYSNSTTWQGVGRNVRDE